MCVDYQRINKLQLEVTKADSGKGCISLIPLPKIDELYAKLKGFKVFSSLDLSSGYYHIGLSESAKPKSAFVLSSLGKYQFNRVPFRLAQAPAYFQKLINDILRGCNFTMNFFDDIIIYSRNKKKHLEHLEEIFRRLRAAGLKLKLEKCCFFKIHIQYLGHLISAEGIQPLPEKLESIAKMPAPRTLKEVKQFLGLVGYYCKNQVEVKDNHGHVTKVHRRDVKKIPMIEKVSQIYEEEQVGKTRNGRKGVPASKMPIFDWNIEKQQEIQGTEYQPQIEKENPTPQVATQEILETQGSQDRLPEMLITVILLIYSFLLNLRQTSNSAIETVRNKTNSLLEATRKTS